MKLRTVLALSVLGSVASSVSVYAFTRPEGHVPTAAAALTQATPAAAVRVSSRFAVDETVALEARLGHDHLVAGGERETFIALEARGTQPSGTVRPPLSVALVIDRSGSMEGSRIAQAIRAARGVVDRLSDGDLVTVVSFDDTARLNAPATELNSESRKRIAEAIDRIGLGDTTCISCGVDMAMTELVKHTGRVHQMIVLSDGQANMGIQKSSAFTELATTARSRGIAISTIGVGLGYDERHLAAISAGSNGQHHFVENDAGLPTLFEGVAKSFASTVASDVRAEIDLDDGVELVEVLDRTFERSGKRIIVSLGSLSRGEAKTVLLKVRMPASEKSIASVAKIGLRYEDHVRKKQAMQSGMLQMAVSPSGSARANLDPFVAERIERSRTGALLEEANELLRTGKTEEAQRKLAKREAELDALEDKLSKDSLADERRADINRQIQAQKRVTARAKSDLSPATSTGNAPPKPAQVAPSVKQNQVDAFRSGL